MNRFIPCVCSGIVSILMSGCATASLKVPPEVLAEGRRPNSIVWGTIIPNMCYYQSSPGNGDFSGGVWWASREGWLMPGLLPAAVGLGGVSSATIVFEGKGVNREFTTTVRGNGERFFVCALPEGEYRFTIDVRCFKQDARINGKYHGDRTITVAGDGGAVYIGSLFCGVPWQSSPLLYHSYGSLRDFEGLAKKFLSDNPLYEGGVTRQIVTRNCVFKR